MLSSQEQFQLICAPQITAISFFPPGKIKGRDRVHQLVQFQESPRLYFIEMRFDPKRPC